MKKQLPNVVTILLFSIIFTFSFPFISSAKDKVTNEKDSLLGPINPKWLHYVEAKQSNRSSQQLENRGYIPAPVTVSHIRGKVDPTLSSEYPSTFDLRDANLVTSVKN